MFSKLFWCIKWCTNWSRPSRREAMNEGSKLLQNNFLPGNFKFKSGAYKNIITVNQRVKNKN